MVTNSDSWDERHRDAPPPVPGLPRLFVPFVDRFPTKGVALELACGSGAMAVWLAQRGLDVTGVDVSPVAVERARLLAAEAGVETRCRFAVHDLEGGLPEGPPADVVVCHLFRDPGLDQPIIERLAPGGLLAIAVLSEVGAAPGRFRARAGALLEAFGALDVIAAGEGDGHAWLLATR